VSNPYPVTGYLLFLYKTVTTSGAKGPTCQVAFHKAVLNLTGYNHAMAYSREEKWLSGMVVGVPVRGLQPARKPESFRTRESRGKVLINLYHQSFSFTEVN